MPTYEYACASCGRRFDVVQRFSDPPLETCEACGGALRRVFHPVGIVLKGSGFYSTDNRSSKSLAATKKDPAPESTAAKDAAPSGAETRKDKKKESPTTTTPTP